MAMAMAAAIDALLFLFVLVVVAVPVALLPGTAGISATAAAIILWVFGFEGCSKAA